MREIFSKDKNIIVADFDYQSALFLFKNKYPELDIKIISRHELINKVSYSFAKDPIPFLLKNGIGYKKAKKYLDILLTADVSKSSRLQELFNDLNDNGYLVKDEYGLYELKDSHIFLFEMKYDAAIQEFMNRNGLAYEQLRLEDLELVKNNAYISPNIIYFENKMSQFLYIFSWIRDKVKENVNQKHRIIINGNEDIFYVKIMSDLFDLPVCYIEERPLLSVKKVKAKINEIYNSKEFAFNEEELEDQDVKALKDLIDYYDLSHLDSFEIGYANLLEIVASKNTRIPVGNKGIVISNKFTFSPEFFTYVTNFNSDKFYKIYQDDNVLPDTILKEIGYNTSYQKTAVEKRNKINFLRHNNVAILSRVKKHLNELIYDSPLVEELGWKDNVKIEDENLFFPTFTSEASDIRRSMILDKENARVSEYFYRTYDQRYTPIECGNDFKKDTWYITNLETYINCPFKYYLNILIPIKRDDYSRRFNGTFIHKVFEKFNHSDFNIEEAFKEGEETFLKEFEKNEIQPTPEELASLEIIKHWLRKLIKTYRKVSDDISFAKPVEDDYELRIKFKLEDNQGETYNFSGRIDKIVVTELNDKKYYSIVDYKSGSESFKPLEVFLGKSIQLPLYYYAIEENIQPDFYTKGGVFGGFYIQHLYFNSIKSGFKDNNTPRLMEKNLISSFRLSGINNQDTNYIISVDPSAFNTKTGKVVTKGTNLLQVKNQFNDPEGDEQIIDNKKVLIDKYNLNDLVEDAKEAAIETIHRICEADFPIAPTSLSPSEFNDKKLVCTYCPYKAVCYHDKSDAVDYRKKIWKRFQKGEK